MERSSVLCLGLDNAAQGYLIDNIASVSLSCRFHHLSKCTVGVANRAITDILHPRDIFCNRYALILLPHQPSVLPFATFNCFDVITLRSIHAYNVHILC